jgi:hypothetical protein
MGVPRVTEYFATREEMETRLSLINVKHSLKYVLVGLFDRPSILQYNSPEEFESFGLSEHGATNHQPTFLVLSSDQDVGVHPVKQRRGGMLYAIDEVSNPSSMLFVPAGLFREQCLIMGRLIATSDPRSIMMYQEFRRLFIQGFQKIGRYYLTLGAIQLYESGVRLTSSAGSPPEFDLHL